MPSEAAIALIACAFLLLAGLYAACLLRKSYDTARGKNEGSQRGTMLTVEKTRKLEQRWRDLP